jgi:hypothetical protein
MVKTRKRGVGELTASCPFFWLLTLQPSFFSRPFVSLTQDAKIAEKSRKMDFESKTSYPEEKKENCGL